MIKYDETSRRKDETSGADKIIYLLKFRLFETHDKELRRHETRFNKSKSHIYLFFD